jgi:DNA-binding GntR family transcriptional regulator
MSSIADPSASWRLRAVEGMRHRLVPMIADRANRRASGEPLMGARRRLPNMAAMSSTPTALAARGADAGDTRPALRRQSDDAYETLARAIVRCDVAPGTIVSEAELAARFGLKTAATRAAVDRLSVMGLLRPVHRRGYVVKPITLRDVHDLFQLRTIIEVAVARLAAGRVDEAALRRLNTVRTKGYRPRDRASESEFLRANTEFHLAVARATGNDRLVSTLAQTLSEMERLFHFGLAARNRSAEMRAEHGALITALARGDADAAERVTRDELEASKAMVVDALLSSESLLDVAISHAPGSAAGAG